MNKRNHFLSALLALALMTLACGLKLPVTKFTTGPTQVEEIQVPLPADTASNVELLLEFAAGELKLKPGATAALVSGTATFNVADLKPVIETNENTYTVRQGDLELNNIPVFPSEFKCEWDLQLANRPMSLGIKAGAYQGTFELGGLTLEKLAITDGGSTLEVSFSEPNQGVMSSFAFATGASTVTLNNLANANFEKMTFVSGAGTYILDFSGELQRDASINIDSAVATISINVPPGVNARVSVESGLSTINTNGEWSKQGDVYTLAGSGPTLTFSLKVGAGTVNLDSE